jgi:hypothetical protein
MTHGSNANNSKPVIPEAQDVAEDSLALCEGAVGVGAVGVGPVGPLGFPGTMFTGIRRVGTAVGPTVGPAEAEGLAETEGETDGYLEVEGLAELVGAGDVEGTERFSPKQPQRDTALR